MVAGLTKAKLKYVTLTENSEKPFPLQYIYDVFVNRKSFLNTSLLNESIAIYMH